MTTSKLTIIGGGLAGAEAAWQAASRGVDVELFEMRPVMSTGAHTGADLAELVCSNSLGSNLVDRASGLLKAELRRLGSLLIDCADQTAVPAGSALAVDRVAFSRLVTERVEAHPRIQVRRQELTEIPDSCTIVASGPLTSSRLSGAIAECLGSEHLFFYDAISPIVAAETIDMGIAFSASRYSRGLSPEGDYINCPFSREEFDQFVGLLLDAERIELKEFEQDIRSGVRSGMHSFFEGCLPVEILAERDPRALAFGPMRPVGLDDPRTGRRPYAVVQLRQDNLSASLFNLVGFQTNLRFSEQRRVFRHIPGLAEARFERYGQMHRNTFIYSPDLLLPTMQSRLRDDLFFAGQITGIEGYAGNIASGWLAGVNAARRLRHEHVVILPPECMIGALCHYVTHADPADFQPMKANFGLLPGLGTSGRSNRRERAEAYAQRSLSGLDSAILSDLRIVIT